MSQSCAAAAVFDFTGGALTISTPRLKQAVQFNAEQTFIWIGLTSRRLSSSRRDLDGGAHT